MLSLANLVQKKQPRLLAGGEKIIFKQDLNTTGVVRMRLKQIGLKDGDGLVMCKCRSVLQSNKMDGVIVVCLTSSYGWDNEQHKESTLGQWPEGNPIEGFLVDKSTVRPTNQIHGLIGAQLWQVPRRFACELRWAILKLYLSTHGPRRLTPSKHWWETPYEFSYPGCCPRSWWIQRFAWATAQCVGPTAETLEHRLRVSLTPQQCRPSGPISPSPFPKLKPPIWSASYPRTGLHHWLVNPYSMLSQPNHI